MIDLRSLRVEYISMSLYCNRSFIDLLQNSFPLSTHILFVLRLDLSKTFVKALVISIPFLSFKG